MKKLLAMALLAASAVAARADMSGYFMLSIFSPGQLPSPACDVYGVRCSLLYGECHSLSGLDLGLYGTTREYVNGLQLNGVSVVLSDMNGAQLGLFNWVENEFAGFQCGVLANVADDLAGLQLGCVNTYKAFGDGAQVGLLNFAGDLAIGDGEFNGLQLGVSNSATDVCGCQIGLVNYAQSLSGLQLGLLNFANKNAKFSFFPFFNFGF